MFAMLMTTSKNKIRRKRTRKRECAIFTDVPRWRNGTQHLSIVVAPLSSSLDHEDSLSAVIISSSYIREFLWEK